MRGRSSRGQGGGCKGGMVIDNKLDKLKDEPHLSGAYIRSLVKQLTSSRSKDPTNPREDPDGSDGFPAHQNLTKYGEVSSEGQPQPPPPLPLPPPQPPHKKQVRRRLHTSRPYQERLLNMAEARREIVTALKFHRAAMKQANEQQQQPPLPPPPQQAQPQPQPFRLPAQQSSSVQEGKIKSRRNPRIYPSNNSSSFSHYVENLSYDPTFCSSSPNPYPWPTSQIAPPPAITETENLNLALPNQTLGLNLNFHDFNNLDATLYLNSSNSQSIYSSSMSPSSLSSTTSPSPTTLSVATDQEVPTSIMTGCECGGGGLGLHPAMDDEEIAEIRSIGEQHQMEWNDTMNLVTSAWWFKFWKTTEIGPEEDKGEDDDGHGYHPFDEKVMEIPAWLNANDSCLPQHYFNQHCSDDCLQDPALLPCMDIGEIEGMDEEWLA